MRVQASTKQRDGDIRNDKGVGRITLSAESDDDREFITSIYRILADHDPLRQEQGVATMRWFLRGFPESEYDSLREQRRTLTGDFMADAG